ncbi:MAG: SGNH/GDSL hydrolase family protein [Desulfobacterales bacterium]|nr:SGNH/GDSL hydrolase family protein [Desulfobacterales bacterium]
MGQRLKRWINQQGQIVELLQSKFHARYIILSCVPPMHLFPALPQPLRFYLGSRAKQFNSALKLFADGCKACEFVTINFPLEAAYVADDGFHPGALAYKIWANHLAVVIRNRLAEEVPLNIKYCINIRHGVRNGSAFFKVYFSTKIMKKILYYSEIKQGRRYKG